MKEGPQSAIGNNRLASHPIVAAAFATGATPKDKAAAMRYLLAFEACGPLPDAKTIKAVFRKAVPAGALSAFIVHHAQRYVEPERRSTKQGAHNELSAAKYRASLMIMTRLSLRDAARAAGVSYGVLAKWKTEDDFMKQADAHIARFVAIDWNAVLTLSAMQYEKDLAALFELPRAVADAAIRAFSPRIVNCGDYNLYGVRLLKALFARYDALDEQTRQRIGATGTLALDFENYIHSQIFLPMLLGDREMKRLVGRKTRDDLLRVIAEVERALGMATENDPERERRIALLALGTVRRIAERLDA